MNRYNFLAIDMGATSGRAVVGSLSDKGLETAEIHRFPNRFIKLFDRYYWNVYGLLEEIKKSLVLCGRQGIKLQSMGIDTWGVDFGYVGADGMLLGLPRAYRDPYTEGAPDDVYRMVSRRELYMRTGIQIMNFNSIFQLYRDSRQNLSVVPAAESIFFMPDLLTYLLTGRKICEYSIASTSQLLNPETRLFDRDLALKLGINSHLLTDPLAPGTIAGPLLPSIAAELGVEAIPVVAVAGHDTASAVAAVPAPDGNFAYLSSGTWSLMGIETDSPIINEASMHNNFTNEGGIDGTIRFLKNITGLWLLEECRREWSQAGRACGYNELADMAVQSAGISSLIDPNDPLFANPASMSEAIREYCRRTEQQAPQSDGEFAALIFNSLAACYGRTLTLLKEMAPFDIRRLHVIGGGSQNRLLNRLTARAVGIPVLAGPAEATAIGNVMIQAKAAGIAADRWAMREMIASSFPPEIFNP
ncbi:MAG: rhamnulokinase [Tannerellaceae bacterium]|jgi:rhamnulokinase|nr:rhamnulokinase [Tannerellaceae bacterium]